MTRHLDLRNRIFKDPPPANVRWSAIETMLIAFGATISEGRGSRVRVTLNGIRATLHRPHPQPQATRPLVRNVRKLLIEADLAP